MATPQKFGSASSYGKKYALGNLFGIEPKGLIQNYFYQKRLKAAIAEQQPEDRMASLKEDRSAAGTRLLEEIS